MPRSTACSPSTPSARFGRFEKALAEGGEAPLRFAAGVRNEMPQETFLELAAWYHDLGRLAESAQVLELAPQTAEVLYWRARLEPRDAEAAALLQKADEASPELVFPFRPESAEVLQWAASRSTSWRPRYYLALVHWGAGNLEEARRLLDECGERPDYAPFYAARSLASESTGRERSMADLERAARLDPAQWRFGRMLAERQLRQGASAPALETVQRYATRFPANYILGMLHAKALLANGRYRESADRLARLHVIPYEGSVEGRRLYREAHLMLAVEAFRKKRPRRCPARDRRGTPLAREPRGRESRTRRTSTSVSRTGSPRSASRAAERAPSRASSCSGSRPSAAASAEPERWCTRWP